MSTLQKELQKHGISFLKTCIHQNHQVVEFLNPLLVTMFAHQTGSANQIRLNNVSTRYLHLGWNCWLWVWCTFNYIPIASTSRNGWIILFCGGKMSSTEIVLFPQMLVPENLNLEVCRNIKKSEEFLLWKFFLFHLNFITCRHFSVFIKCSLAPKGNMFLKTITDHTKESWNSQRSTSLIVLCFNNSSKLSYVVLKIRMREEKPGT